jgi:hypothetical protein
MRRLPKTAANLDGTRATNWRTVRRTAPYLWPEGEPWAAAASSSRSRSSSWPSS